MNMQGQRFFETRGFRIAVIAVAAVAALALAAYWFGTGLRADTPASVAASPAGSSLTAVRESRLDDYYGRFSSMNAAARPASLAANPQADFYAELNKSAAAARPASLAANPQADFYAELNKSAAAASRFEDRYNRMNSPSTSVRAALLDMIERSGSVDYSTRAKGLWFDIPASGTMAIQPESSVSSIESSAAVMEMIERSGSADYSTRARGLWFDIPAAGTMAIQPAGSQSSRVESPAAASSASPVASRDDDIGPLISASAAARLTALAALAKSRADFHAELNASPSMARAASPEAASRFEDRYDRMNSSSAAVKTALLEMIERSGSADYSTRARGLWFDIPAAGTMAIQPESSVSSIESSTADQFQWIKPEEIKPSETVGSATSQYQWIKPEGINPK